MALPILQSDQPGGGGVGTAGQGRNDLQIAGGVVNITDTEAANVGASYVYVLEDTPIGSSAVLNNPLTAAPDFTPDVTGSYRIRCTVNGSASSTEVYAVPLPNTGSRIPSFGEKTEYDAAGNMLGWHEALTDFMRQMDGAISGAHGVPGEKLIDTIRCGNSDSQSTATPKTQGPFQFNPLDHALTGTTRSLVFRAVAANGGGAALTKVQLWSVTDSEAIATLDFTTSAFAMAEANLTEGAGAGEIDLSAKIYEVLIWVDTPDLVDDFIDLGTAEIRVINTVA